MTLTELSPNAVSAYPASSSNQSEGEARAASGAQSVGGHIPDNLVRGIDCDDAGGCTTSERTEGERDGVRREAFFDRAERCIANGVLANMRVTTHR